MSVTQIPRRTSTATATELAETSVKSLGDLLNAIRDDVLVVAHDIPEEQRQEIIRELSLMCVMNKKASEALGLPELPRSFHLQREEATA